MSGGFFPAISLDGFVSLSCEIRIICPIGLHIIQLHFQVRNPCVYGYPQNQKRFFGDAKQDAGTNETAAATTRLHAAANAFPT